MKQFGKKRGKKIIKSLTASHEVMMGSVWAKNLTGVMNFKSSTQGADFWWELQLQQAKLERVK
jgi:hypothetical protein